MRGRPRHKTQDTRHDQRSGVVHPRVTSAEPEARSASWVRQVSKSPLVRTKRPTSRSRSVGETAQAGKNKPKPGPSASRPWVRREGGERVTALVAR